MKINEGFTKTNNRLNVGDVSSEIVVVCLCHSDLSSPPLKPVNLFSVTSQKTNKQKWYWRPGDGFYYDSHSDCDSLFSFTWTPILDHKNTSTLKVINGQEQCVLTS